jgi:hemerythrin superfamily protein
MEATRLLIQDHRTVDDLFTRYEGSSTGAAEQRREIVDEIIRELSVHAAIEEQVLYPTIRSEVPGGEALHQEALREHQEAKEILSDLESLSPGEAEFDTKVRSLIQDVRHHVEEEEGELFPKLREAVDAARLEEMGDSMERAKKVAPTRPHPKAPSTPPANLVAGPTAAVVDRARDAAREAPTTPRKAGTRARKTRQATATGRRTRGGRTSQRGGRRTGRRTTYHVTPDPQGGWRAAKEGASRALIRGDNKSEVVSRARQAARGQKGQLLVHGRDGRIQEERTYGEDPRGSKG